MSASAEVRKIYKDYISRGGDPAKISKKSDDEEADKFMSLSIL